MSAIGQDVHYALRTMRRAPGFTAAAILTLSLGIGGSAVAYSRISAALSAASPPVDLDRLAGVWSYHRGEAETKNVVSPFDYLE